MLNLLITKNTKPEYLVKRLSYLFNKLVESVASGNKSKADTYSSKIKKLSQVEFKNASFTEAINYAYRKHDFNELPEPIYDYVVNNLPLYLGITRRVTDSENTNIVMLKKMLENPEAHFGQRLTDYSYYHGNFYFILKGLIEKNHFRAALIALDAIVNFAQLDRHAYKLSYIIETLLIPSLWHSDVISYLVSNDKFLAKAVSDCNLSSDLRPRVEMEDALRLHTVGAKNLSKAIFYNTVKYPAEGDRIDILLVASQLFRINPDLNSWYASASAAFDRDNFEPGNKPLKFYAYHFLNSDCNTLPFISKKHFSDFDKRLLTLSSPLFLSGLRDALDASPDRTERAHELISRLERLSVNDEVKIALAKELPNELLKPHHRLKRLLVSTDLSL